MITKMGNPIFDNYTRQDRERFGVRGKYEAEKFYNTMHTTEVVTRSETDDFTVERLDTGIKTNVPVNAILHSPTGFEFGYGGSGPADLALNILLAVTKNLPYSIQYHQQFKYEFVVPLKGEQGVIKYNDVLEFLKNNPVEQAEIIPN